MRGKVVKFKDLAFSMQFLQFHHFFQLVVLSITYICLSALNFLNQLSLLPAWGFFLVWCFPRAKIKFTVSPSLKFSVSSNSLCLHFRHRQQSAAKRVVECESVDFLKKYFQYGAIKVPFWLFFWCYFQLLGSWTTFPSLCPSYLCQCMWICRYTYKRIHVYLYTPIHAQCKHTCYKDNINGAICSMLHALSITMIPLYFLATFCVVPALHRHSFTIVLGSEVALDDGSFPSIPRLKISWSFSDYILKPQ